MLAEQRAYPGFADTYRSELLNPLVGQPRMLPKSLHTFDQQTRLSSMFSMSLLI
jgi:hypothetical protein